MTTTLPADDILYAALLARDPAYDGHAFVGVTTTGIFCRLSCPARKPLFENTRYFDSVAACYTAGFRPCLRCRPVAQVGAREPVVAMLMARLDAEPDRVWSEEDLIALDLDPSTVRRAFRRHIGTTFLDLARLRRAGRGVDRIAGGASVIDAQIEAGYDSGSGFRDAVIRLIGDAPAALRGTPLLTADWIETPLGAMLAIADATHLHLLEFFDRKALPEGLARLRQRTGAAIVFGRTPPIDRIAAELSTYFDGTDARFTGPIAAHAAADFTASVWTALQTIPPGETRSYSALATTIGRPSAVRALARANGANQLAIVIPCHRVIGADGTLTGYAGGLWRKRWLIEHERRHFA
ncbi:6-O-methylguanine DNA methyltransferase [Sphingomonas sp. Leaf17]|uniref:bifunctional transcriptional activator/DNA repair enzyme AdaA n=1 Tax=Sphingomonas sp. Leaf17 TaxID=1735683 RepID=UPI0006F8D296|nr:trifunctional transcriptional activator/DNA repair protein Ada/methylated-DNA--[protein]-cysteine S-methyltransferase [Sphingomonas sp. Leaf17]KQM63430.1 6-O-methylguanine DNA methyltransferase [Sphingomonas sp. Leaf17]